MDLKEYIRSIPDYPKKGILFRDITTLIKDQKAFEETINQIVARSKKFDFTQLVSGINLGSNLGTDIFYSGTVGAAIAGLKLRYPPIAFSVASYQPKDLDFIAKKCAEICLYVRNINIANRYLVNVNFPDINENNYIGSKLTTLAEREKPESPIENNSDGWKFRFNASGKMKQDQMSSDIDAINNGFVSVSLFDYDLTRNIDLKKINWNIDGA